MSIPDVDMLAGEEWRPVVGYEDKYLISNLGRVYSMPRLHVPVGRLLTPALNGRGYLTVSLSRGRVGSQANCKIHRLLAEAFIAGPRAGNLVRHLNDIRTDNRLENLAWGTRHDNQQDAVRNGRHLNASKTHCKHGHEYTPENTYVHERGRVCRACSRVHRATHRARRKAAS